MIVLFTTTTARFKARLELHRRAWAKVLSVEGLISNSDGMFSVTKNKETLKSESSDLTDENYDLCLFNGGFGTSALPPPISGGHSQIQFLTNNSSHVLLDKKRGTVTGQLNLSRDLGAIHGSKWYGKITLSA